jgi:hypothetical protein
LMWTATNYYLFSLAVSDLTLLVLGEYFWSRWVLLIIVAFIRGGFLGKCYSAVCVLRYTTNLCGRRPVQQCHVRSYTACSNGFQYFSGGLW